MIPKRAETGIRVSLLYTLPASALVRVYCPMWSAVVVAVDAFPDASVTVNSNV
jgi:hypothetical protein